MWIEYYSTPKDAYNMVADTSGCSRHRVNKTKTQFSQGNNNNQKLNSGHRSVKYFIKANNRHAKSIQKKTEFIREHKKFDKLAEKNKHFKIKKIVLITDKSVGISNFIRR